MGLDLFVCEICEEAMTGYDKKHCKNYNSDKEESPEYCDNEHAILCGCSDYCLSCIRYQKKHCERTKKQYLKELKERIEDMEEEIKELNELKESLKRVKTSKEKKMKRFKWAKI